MKKNVPVPSDSRVNESETQQVYSVWDRKNREERESLLCGGVERKDVEGERKVERIHTRVPNPNTSIIYIQLGWSDLNYSRREKERGQ